jgi:DNA polymerase-3 subunit gamma/tau
MSYVVLARKWRPQSFEDLIGQDHVSTTLEHAIARDRVAHAFLFTGVRGVGKTTSARILAKALNCAEGPTARPCQKCPQCVDITSGSDVDVLEIDGATYTGIDDVRKLQESLPYRPSRDRYKILIVDEVHMLSTSAWNAFLKTLEEPPPHVKFIFATTEVHKVPVTILSRCQRYDFKMLSAQMVHARLKYVLEQEGVAADDAAIAIIAREAAGSMRDGMSLLDQVIAWVGGGDDRLTADGVARVLGVAARTVLHRLGKALIDGDAATAVAIVGDLATDGFDLPHVARDFLGHLRDLVVAKVTPDPTALLDLPAQEVADVQALAALTDTDDLTRLHQGFSRAFDDITRSGQPRAALEMTLVRLARRPPLLPLDELLRRLGELERRLTGGGGGGPSSPGAGGGPRRPAPGEPGPPARRAAAPVEAPARFAAPPSVSPPSARDLGSSPVSARPSSPSSMEPTSSSPPRSPAPAAPPAEPPALAVALDELVALRAILDIVRGERPALASALEHAAPLAVRADKVELAFEASSFLVKQATDPPAVEALTRAVQKHFGAATELRLDVAPAGPLAATIAQLDAAERRSKIEEARRVVAQHPFVTAALELLGAELQDVRLPQDAEA